jgi:hypothetical protein
MWAQGPCPGGRFRWRTATVSIGESLRKIADMDAFRAALNTAREAMAVALPWNRSISAIAGFMLNSNFCSADLLSNKNRAAILTEFVDYAFQRNALNWENRQPFLSTNDLANTWAAWKAKRAAIFTTSNPGQGKKKEEPKKGVKDDICRKYNTAAGCPNAATDCKTYYGFKLHHVCNHNMKVARSAKRTIRDMSTNNSSYHLYAICYMSIKYNMIYCCLTISLNMIYINKV